jgi:hypothetical protein
MAFVLIAIGALFFDADAWKKPNELVSIILIITSFGSAATYFFGEYFKVYGTFNSESIDFYTPWTGEKHERWEDLVSITFNSGATWYVLTFTSGKIIRISNFLVGYEKIMEILHSKGHKL